MQTQYIALVEQSRNPFFYADCAVPDTLDGRFEMIVLHLFLKRESDPEAQRLLLEIFFTDMDRSLREMGVGDMGVGKRIRAMSEAAFGRLKAYEGAISSPATLKEALRKNVYGGAADEKGLAQLTSYCLAPAKLFAA